MEETFQPSLPHFRNRIISIEAIELSVIGFIFWGLLLLIPKENSSFDLAVLIFILLLIEGFLLCSWGIYNVYIRISHLFPRRTDARILVLLAILTSTYTLWTWLLLDINRLILAKLLYCGEAPVEYAWNWRSRQNRKNWEKIQKTSQA